MPKFAYKGRPLASEGGCGAGSFWLGAPPDSARRGPRLVLKVRAGDALHFATQRVQVQWHGENSAIFGTAPA
jgi:hypothetical protein